MSEQDTLPELFARDPLNLTTSDIDKIIEYYISRQNQFNLGVKTKVDEPINLEELGL